MSWLSARRTELGFALWFVVALVFSATRLSVDGSMAALLPPAQQRVAELGQRVIDSNLSRTMLLSVGGSGQDADLEARRVTARMARALDGDPEVSWVLSGPGSDFERALRVAYFPRRFQFLSDDVRQLEEPLLGKEVGERIARLERRLSGPEGPLVRPLAPADPLGSFLDRLDAVTGFGGPRVVHGQFVSRDGQALLLLGLRDSALDGEAQRGLLERVNAAFRASHATGVELEYTGVNVFSVDTETRIRADVSRVAIASTVGIVLVFVLLFRSAFGLLLASLPLVFGLVTATASTLLVFPRIHALTFAFGAALLGVAVDYPVHLLNHRRAAASGEVGKPVRTGIALGALTTLVGIGALAASGYLVMRQVAVFSCTGLAAAALFTLLVLPRLPSPTSAGVSGRVAEGLFAWLMRARRFAGWIALGSACLVVLAAVLVARAHWDTSLQGLAPMSPTLLAEDARVRERFGAPSSSVLILCAGHNDEQALARNDEVARVLKASRDEGLVESFASLHGLVWSSALQRRNFEVAQSEHFAQVVRQALEPRFDVSLFAPFFDAQRALSFDPLSLAALRLTAFAHVVDRFALSEPGQTLIASYPKLRDEAAGRELGRRVEAIPGVYFIEQRRLLDAAYVDLRRRVRWALLCGAFGMALVIGLRFRAVRPALATVIPAVGAPVVGLGVAALFGHGLNLFHLLAALVVLSMAMDYGIFASETMLGNDTGEARTTTLSVVVAALTTCLGFGLLALSSLPVLSAIGVTVAAGIVAAVLLVPVSLWAHGPG
jgi:predicted exporter